MRKCLNSYFHPTDNVRYSELYRKFQSVFDYILTKNNPAIERQEYSDWFVPVPEVENDIRRIELEPKDHIRLFIGYTGVGKSTILRHTFGLSSNPAIVGNTLFLPYFFNATTGSEYVLESMVSSGNNLLQEYFKTQVNDEELYTFILNNKRPLLFSIPSVPSNASNIERLLALKANKFLAYELERLKCLLSKVPITKVFLILDDIEALSQIDQSRLIKQASHVYTCLENFPGRLYTVSVVVSCRPVTRTLLSKEHWSDIFLLDHPIQYAGNVSLILLFKARFDAVNKSMGLREKVGNVKSWNEACDVLSNLVDTLANKIEIVLEELCNHNMRLALFEFQEILSNGTWFQKRNLSRPSFVVDGADYAVTDAAVLRALAYGNGEVYPRRESVLSNIMHNSMDPDSDLMITYLVRYLMLKTLTSLPGWQIATYSEILRDYATVLGKRDEIVKDAIKYMITFGLAEKEVLKPDGEEYISLLPKSKALWRLLGTRSLALEFWRDDTYMDFEDHKAEVTLTFAPEQRFIETCSFLDCIIRSEKSDVNKCASNQQRGPFRTLFGLTLVSRQAFTGLINSVRSYFRNTEGIPILIREHIERLDKDIKNLEDVMYGDTKH